MNICQPHTKRIKCSSHSRWPRATGPRQPSQPLDQPSQFLTWALHTKMKQPLVSSVDFCSGNLILLALAPSPLWTRLFQRQKLGHRPIARAMGSDSDSCSSQGLGDWGTYSQEARLIEVDGESKGGCDLCCNLSQRRSVPESFKGKKVIWKLTSTAANLGEASVGGGRLDCREPSAPFSLGVAAGAGREDDSR
jgi:hypothetical protein